MPYINPIPSPDDEPQSRTIMIPFTFQDPVTKEEAAESINEWFKENRLPAEAIHLTGAVGLCYKTVQPRLGKNDRDPDGYGPRESSRF